MRGPPAVYDKRLPLGRDTVRTGLGKEGLPLHMGQSGQHLAPGASIPKRVCSVSHVQKLLVPQVTGSAGGPLPQGAWVHVGAS